MNKQVYVSSEVRRVVVEKVEVTGICDSLFEGIFGTVDQKCLCKNIIDYAEENIRVFEIEEKNAI